MTEAGMILSQSYLDPNRIPGSVGFPLPGVHVEVLSDTGRLLMEGIDANKESLSDSGLLLVKGKNVFQTYLGRQKSSEDYFGDWFVTGDRVSYSHLYDFECFILCMGG